MVERLCDAYGADVNLLASDNGIAEVLVLWTAHAIAMRSICTDYLMDFPLERADRSELAGALPWIIATDRMLGIAPIVIPFVNTSGIENPHEQQLVRLLKAAIQATREAGTDLRSTGDKGDFVLKVARGAPGDKVEWIPRNRRFTEVSGLTGAR
jgi:hypothetical protein